MKIQVIMNSQGSLILWMAEIKESDFGPVEWCDSGLSESEDEAIQAAHDAALEYHLSKQNA